MLNVIPIHDLNESNEPSCRILKLNTPNDYSIVEAHRHNYYEIFLFDNAGGTHMIDFDTYHIQEQSLHFISPGQIHALHRNKEVTGYVVIFSKEFMLLNLVEKALLSDFPAFNKTALPVLSIESEMYVAIKKIMVQMETEFLSTAMYKEELLASYIKIALLKCKSVLIDTTLYKRSDPASQQLMQHFNNLVEEHFITLHKVNAYADLLNVTPNHLSETIKKITGKTAGELIHERLILEAKRLLLHSTITAKEVAYTLQFNDPSYFSRFFKTHTGLSPEEFRKEIRKKYQH
jgi:AraC family transcriptional regulator, transcriptional activator of pobA